MVILTLLILGLKYCDKLLRIYVCQCIKTFYQGYLLPFYGIYCNTNVFNTERQHNHGMEVNYCGKKFYNIGPWCQYYKKYFPLTLKASCRLKPNQVGNQIV
jgi:hypothetical protein